MGCETKRLYRTGVGVLSIRSCDRGENFCFRARSHNGEAREWMRVSRQAAELIVQGFTETLAHTLAQPPDIQLMRIDDETGKIEAPSCDTPDSESAKRRFGRDYEKKCKHPDIVECAQWECQSRDKCKYED